jgi:hypothetical protein
MFYFFLFIIVKANQLAISLHDYSRITPFARTTIVELALIKPTHTLIHILLTYLYDAGKHRTLC